MILCVQHHPLSATTGHEIKRKEKKESWHQETGKMARTDIEDSVTDAGGIGRLDLRRVPPVRTTRLSSRPMRPWATDPDLRWYRRPRPWQAAPTWVAEGHRRWTHQWADHAGRPQGWWQAKLVASLWCAVCACAEVTAMTWLRFPTFSKGGWV